MTPVARMGEELGTLPVTQGLASAIPVILGADVSLPLEENEGTMITYEIHSPDSLSAPVTKGDRVGTVSILLDGVPLGEAPLLAGESVIRDTYIYHLGRVIHLWY